MLKGGKRKTPHELALKWSASRRAGQGRAEIGLSSEFGGYGPNTTPRLVTPNPITWGLMLDRRALLLFGSHQTLSRARDCSFSLRESS